MNSIDLFSRESPDGNVWGPTESYGQFGCGTAALELEAEMSARATRELMVKILEDTLGDRLSGLEPRKKQDVLEELMATLNWNPAVFSLDHPSTEGLLWGEARSSFASGELLGFLEKALNSESRS